MVPQRHATSKIGLLGGSFNPAHEGHREISLAALDWLGLDAVWWLVSPGNPLKAPDIYAPYEERLAAARRIAADPRIVASDFERRKGLQYTVDTLSMLADLWPQMRFVWLMGADSLAAFHEWKDWRAIAAMVPIAVFSRPGHEAAAEESPAAQALAAFRLDERDGPLLADAEPPAWAFYSGISNPISSTALRRARRAG
ncbi:nicotinate-nucleotide adenylyltransferase [Amphiplicatus metriothermophilus]|uniref:Probable nicotinate-nucleotide adenylyltransferase n=1 Tax=Amphiplicatus metriothermophilus TaxID=1519374 RepID=A0A239PKB4_9PROT|nr:nicotinate-nucleotide adenylyltransferase [Amphiplicatus metriothermophilus]MBB5517903.1 nicotinate-nucleotide adenylyltransferase [Amphiplicatus metriothermophilus]SNT67763.1 nicotinate-nucleotide adenylyltransferase [Amphiplicatus metriothermophilus]